MEQPEALTYRKVINKKRKISFIFIKRKNLFSSKIFLTFTRRKKTLTIEREVFYYRC